MEGKWPGKARKSVVLLTLRVHGAVHTADRSADLADDVGRHSIQTWLEGMCRVP